MIHGLKPYPEYKASALSWVGTIPRHWDEKRAKYLFREVDERSKTGKEELLSVSHITGVTPRSQKNVTMFMAESTVGHKICRPGDLVINTLWAWMGALGVSQFTGLVSPAYGVYRPCETSPLSSAFIGHLLRSPQYVSEYICRSTGIQSSRLRLYAEQLLEIPVVCPPPDEQRLILRYLAHVDRRIRRYIAAKKKLIALLNEQKQAIIQRAVTRGLDPDVRLRPSGVEWLGDVPDKWEVRRAKQLSQVLRGKFTHRPRNDPFMYDGPYPFIQTGEVARASKTITAYRQTLNERGLAVSKRFPAGTLVMTIAANIGHVAVLDFEACFPDSVVGFVPRAGVERDYLYYVFRAMRPELLREAPVNTQGNLNVDRIGSRGIAIPSLSEQLDIILRVESNTADIDSAIERASREIDLLREYRTRLIADVVTGKLDVREAAAQLPDEATDSEPLDDADPLTEDDDADPDATSEEAEG